MADAVDIDYTREMTAASSTIWNVLDDVRRLPDWLAFAVSVEDVSSDAAAEGVTYTVKPPRRFEPKTHWRIAEVQAPHRQVHTSEMPMLRGVTSTIEILGPAEGGSTRVHVHWRGEPSNVFGRLMRGMFQRQIQANWERSLEELDRVASAGA